MIGPILLLAVGVALSMMGNQIGAAACGIVALSLLVAKIPDDSGCNHNCRQGRACEACRIRKEAHQHFCAYYEIVGNLGCAAALAEALRPDVLVHKNEFNRLMERLAQIDPQAPTTRL